MKDSPEKLSGLATISIRKLDRIETTQKTDKK